MPKKKDQKRKERERRVAKKKLAETAQRREQEKTTQVTRKTDKPKRLTDISPPKPDHIPGNQRSPFVHRRTGS